MRGMEAEKTDRRRSPDVRTQAEANVLVLQYQPLLKKTVKRLQPFWERRGMLWDDAFQEAQIGLMRAARKWDSRREGGFYHFAQVGILHAIKHALGTTKLIHVPNNYYNARDPQPFRKEAQRAWHCVQSTQRRSYFPGETWEDWIPAKATKQPLDLQVDAALRCLDRRSRLIIRLRFWEGLLLEEVGQALSLSRERVRQIEDKALIKLHRRFRQLMPDIRQRLQAG